VAQATPPAPAPSVVPVTSAAGKPGRRIRNVGPVRRRPSEAPAVAEIPPAPGEAAAPGDAPAPGATVGSEAATDEVFWLSVRSTPPGADVLIDGQVEGKTPFQRRIFDPNRSYALTIRKPGFEAIERSLGSGEQWIKKGNVRTLTVNARLNPAADTTATEQKPGETAPPAERKSNPFDEPAPASGPQP